MSAEERCVELNILIPQKPTLAKYGLSREEWLQHLEDQDYKCGTCGTLPNVSIRYKGRRFVTDHEHVRGWAKMPPERRKLYVRGLLCFWCNKTYVGRAITVAIAEGVLAYLLRYEARRPR